MLDLKEIKGKNGAREEVFGNESTGMWYYCEAAMEQYLVEGKSPDSPRRLQRNSARKDKLICRLFCSENNAT